MTVEEMARAAYYAHIAGYADDDLLDDHHRDEMVAAIASVATAAIEEEREACAKICDPPDRLKDVIQVVLRDRAAAIRARGEKQ